MIIEGLLSVVQKLLTLLLSPIDIPSLPSNVQSIITQAMGYIIDGLGILAAFTHYQFIMALIAIVLVIEAAFLIYKFVLWILRKIPAAAIE